LEMGAGASLAAIGLASGSLFLIKWQRMKYVVENV